MKNQRRYISVIFGAILLLPLLAIGILQIGEAYIKSTREERMETEKLVQVILPASKVVWEEEEKELWVGDSMFDVASYTIKDGNYYLTGVFDKEETEVAGTLLHSIFSINNTELLQLLLLLQCFFSSILLIALVSKYLPASKKNEFYFALFPSPSLMILGPPPRR